MTGSRIPALPLLAILALVAAVFARGLGGGLVYDDLVLFQRNPSLHAPLDVGSLLFEPLYDAAQGYWRPLTSLVLAWGHALGGSLALHALALALHLVCVVQVAGLGRDLGLPRAATLWGALLFGVCPVVVEPVAWIAAINDPLWALCGLLALRAHLRWRRDGCPGVPWRLGLLFGLGLLAKENALSIPLVLVALDVVHPPRPGAREVLRAYATVAVVALAWVGARALLLGDAALGAAGPVALEHPWLRRVEVAGRLLLALVFPLDPTPFAAPADELGGVALAVPSIALAALVVVLWSALRRGWRPVAFAGLVFLAVALPVVARLDAVGSYPIADRYLYLASAVAALALAWVVGHLSRAVARVALGAAVAVCAGVSFVHVGVWSDQETLVQAGLSRHPDDPRMHFMLGQLRLESLGSTPDPAALREALDRFRTAERLLERAPWNGNIAAVPLRAETRLGLAWCGLISAGRRGPPEWRVIVADFERITSDYPNLAPAWVGLGVALASGGRPRDARAAFERAVELDPRLFQARFNLARVLTMLGDKEGALRQLDAALRLRPGDPTARAMRQQLER